MGLSNIATPNHELQSALEIWGYILFWAFLLSTLLYLVVGVFLAIVLPTLKKRLRILIPFLYLIYGLIRLLFVEAVASGFIAGIYVTSGWTLTTGVSIAWGLGLSLVTNLLSMLISWVPLYGFL